MRAPGFPALTRNFHTLLVGFLRPDRLRHLPSILISKRIVRIVKLLQIAIFPSEVVGQFVDDRLANLDAQLLRIGEVLLQRLVCR